MLPWPCGVHLYVACTRLQLVCSQEEGRPASLQVRVSFLEIYNEDVRDLLSSNPRNALEIREDADGSVYVKGLHAFLVKSPTEIASILQVCITRAKGDTPEYGLFEMHTCDLKPQRYLKIGSQKTCLLNFCFG